MGYKRYIWIKLCCALFLLQACTLLSGQTFFEDVTSSRGILASVTSKTFGSGASAVDFDQDGDIDIFIGTNEDSFSHLYRNDGNGNFEEISASVGLEIPGDTYSAIWFDYNGDGTLDLFVGSIDLDFNNLFVKLYKQELSGQFTDVTEESGLNIEGFGRLYGGAAVGDINNDGFLDLYFAGWIGERYLFKNNGDGTFTDITESSLGLRTQQHLQPLFYDFNRDGFIDLQLNIDHDNNEFFINNGDNTFTNIAASLGTDSDFNEMGITIGDYDNDGDMEMYMSNIEDNVRHNVFYRNDTDENGLAFTEIANDLGVGQAGWGWGVVFFDADNDGYLDLATTNGWEILPADQTRYWHNNQDGTFTDASEDVNYSYNRYGTTLIAIDFDRDGDLDLVESLKAKNVTTTDPDYTTTLILMQNNLDRGSDKNYVVIKPRMQGTNKMSIGSQVEITMGDLRLIRPITAGISFWGQEPAEAFFGIGSATSIDQVSIVWPGGEVSTWDDIEINKEITLTDSDARHTPANLKLSSQKNGVILSWKHMQTNQTAYLIQKSLDENFENFEEFSVGANDLEFLDTDVDDESNYYYRVRALFANSKSSALSIPISGKLSDLIKPSDLKALDVGIREVELTWEDNSRNEIGFEIERSLTEEFLHTTSYELSENSTSFLSDELVPNTTFYFRIRAFNEKDFSQYSEVLTVKTEEVIDVVTDLHDPLELSKPFRIFPNPTQSNVTVQLENSYLGPLKINLINSAGIVSASWDLVKNEFNWSTNIELSDQSGIYLLVITTPDEVFTKKILKSK